MLSPSQLVKQLTAPLTRLYRAAPKWVQGTLIGGAILGTVAGIKSGALDIVVNDPSGTSVAAEVTPPQVADMFHLVHRAFDDMDAVLHQHSPLGLTQGAEGLAGISVLDGAVGSLKGRRKQQALKGADENRQLSRGVNRVRIYVADRFNEAGTPAPRVLVVENKSPRPITNLKVEVVLLANNHDFAQPLDVANPNLFRGHLTIPSVAPTSSEKRQAEFSLGGLTFTNGDGHAFTYQDAIARPELVRTQYIMQDYEIDRSYTPGALHGTSVSSADGIQLPPTLGLS